MQTRRVARKTGLVVAATATLAVAAAGPAGAQTGSIAIGSGTLTGTVSNVTLGSVTLNGADQTSTGSPAEAWTAVDARGTGAAWSITATGGTLTSAAGVPEITARTLPASSLALAPGAVTAGLGSDPTTNLTTTTLTMSTSAQTYLSCSSTCKGTYSYTPGFTLTVPANAYRSNYTIGSSGALNPYTVTLTITIA
jgi:hypothetical protein